MNMYSFSCINQSLQQHLAASQCNLFISVSLVFETVGELGEMSENCPTRDLTGPLHQ